MSANEPLTLALVREFILKNGSRVRNHDLITHFRTQLNDPVNKGKVRADFKEYVHQLTTVQTIDGEKYFVLKKPKEAPAVLRKPPTRPHTTHHKPRPVSAMPVARHAKMFEEMAAARYPMTRSHSEDHAMNELPDKENRPRELKALSDMVKSGSIDSMDSVGSTHSTPKMGRKISQPGKRQGDSLERNSQALSEDVFEDPDIDGDDLMNIPTIQLDAIEKEWLLTTARGNRAHIMCLLEQEPLLAKRKDFTSCEYARFLGLVVGS
ncbi:uncharacterized protein LOC116603344 [Nematostella vectensis]|uniref:uncharacterized protein LOC116603344 n=1 Tax=Nematostella vectensis TaxID=45351 RepID=UPI0020776CBF|nr:uncharacterized protein LOC116603344 [Nematostella vectensis]